MQPTRRRMRLLVYVPTPEQRRRVLHALDGWTVVVPLAVADPARGATAFATTGCVAAIVAPLDDAGRSTTPLVRLLCERWPALPVLVAMPARPCPATYDALISAVQVGACAALPDPLAVAWVRAKLAEHHLAIGARRGLRDTLDVVPDPARAILECCLLHPGRMHRVEDVARQLGVHRRTLSNWSQVAQVPVPEVLIGWSLTLLAAHLLTQTAYSTERIAASLGFVSAEALRSIVRRCGLSIRELRTASGFETAVNQFVRTI